MSLLLSAIASRPVFARASARRKSNHAGGSRLASLSRTSSLSTESMKAVSSSPECKTRPWGSGCA